MNLSGPPVEQPTVNTQPTTPDQLPVVTDTPPQSELISEPVQPETPVADSDKRKRRRAFVGVVDGEPGATVDVIRNGTQQRVTIRLEDYKLKTPGKTVAASFADGARVVVLSQRDGEEWVAVWVMVKPQKLVNRPVIGTVVGVENGVLTIVQPDGTTSTIELPEGFQAPDAGEVITLFASDTGAGEGGAKNEGRRKAKGLVKASKVRARLEGFLQELTTDEASVSEEAPRGKLRSALLKVEDAREKALAAREDADAARARADAAQQGDSSDLNELALDAEEDAVEAEFELAEAESDLAEIQAEAAERSAKAETKRAERRAKRVSDVASVLDTLTAQHTQILQSLADGSILPAEALRGIATALENAKRDRTQANLKAELARARSEDKKKEALARAKERREKARARAVEKAEKAQAKAAEKAEKDKAKAARKAQRDIAKAERNQAKAAEKVEKEQARTADRAQKEQARAAEKAQNDQARAADRAQKEQARAADKAEKEQARAVEKTENDQVRAAQKAEREQAQAAEKAEADRQREAAKAKADQEREAAKAKADQGR